ncbi:rubrerythrin family protein [Oceanispirochaeta crateris]|uniref:Rubrerythrin family protein n=1 Tax=Oceanispirochaeta crateris TaxID=2518645 RepID=A0A5C1QNR9_9SPIO|nr:rubrerythrin family protein [Oceanispirochaeta crateris]QEN08216.1 rubrerythrin family protein [Oceanispirochaeta crateris]
MPNTSTFSDNSLSIIFSNLAKAAGRQQNYETEEFYNGLSGEYTASKSGIKDLSALKENIAQSLKQDYPELQKQAESIGDRGVLRALKWGEKVTTIQKSLVDRFLSKGESLMEGKDIFICEACGFIFLGETAPAICPVCKAPESRFSKIK